MKAVALTGFRRLEVVDTPEPEPGPGDLKLRVRYCGICGSDLHDYRLEGSPRLSGVFTPIMGHEFSGEVVAVGTGVSGFQMGDVVVVMPSQPCGECEVCLSGEEDECPRRYLSLGYTRPGAYAEYICVRAFTAIKVEPAEAADKAALSEPLSVAMWAVRRGRLQPGESVLITGAGPIGALTCLVARRAGAGRIVVSETATGRRELARRLGAEVMNPSEGPIAERIIDPTTLEGVNIAFECAGVSAAMDDCLGSIGRYGRVVVVSLFDEPYSIDLVKLMLSQQQVIGTYGFAEEFEEAARLILSGEIDVGPLISERIGLAEVPDAFAELVVNPGAHHKVLVCPDM